MYIIYKLRHQIIGTEFYRCLPPEGGAARPPRVAQSKTGGIASLRPSGFLLCLAVTFFVQ